MNNNNNNNNNNKPPSDQRNLSTNKIIEKEYVVFEKAINNVACYWESAEIIWKSRQNKSHN